MNTPVSPAPPYDVIYSKLLEAWPIEEYESLYLAQDILARIKLMETEQEIALHSFFHIPYDDHAFSPAHVLSECKNADTLGEKYGLPFVLWVFPRNRERYRSLLKDNGFTHCRGRSPSSNSILLVVMDMFGSPRHGWAFASNFSGLPNQRQLVT